MTADFADVSLLQIAAGAGGELFDREFERILSNIADPNTPAEAKRSVVLEVTITPEEDRERGILAVSVSSKLASPRAHGTTVYMGQRGSTPVAKTTDIRQRDMFTAPDDSVTPMPRTREVAQ